ncbi:restriction endonuclease [Sorangium sp. So ce693]|uniref:restriction endonuclease n=1 Tax=Sorangium sp. So ce693 TaxID=3133318 RepID=UPI003F5F47E1
MAKIYSPQVFEALAESLRTIYWYTNDLKSFLIRCGVPREHVARLDWTYKRTAVRELLDDLAVHGATGTKLVGNLIGGVVEQDERFPHLAKLDDGRAKVRDAREAVRDLKNLLGHQTVVAHAEAARAENRTEAERRRAEKQQWTETLATLKHRFMALGGMTDHNQRGLKFQLWLRELFALHDLEPRGSFASIGEQIDGSIRIDGQTLLVEARWTKDRVAPEGVRDFVGKFEQKLDNTLGLMVSIQGFTDAAGAKATSSGRLLTIFMDGQDIYPVLDGLVDLRQLLSRKLRHAAEKGEPMYRIGQ